MNLRKDSRICMCSAVNTDSSRAPSAAVVHRVARADTDGTCLTQAILPIVIHLAASITLESMDELDALTGDAFQT